MRSLTFLLAVGAFLTGLHAGCQDPNDSCNKGYRPSDCIWDAPASGILELRVTPNSLNAVVPVAVFHGPVENNDLVFLDTLAVTTAEYHVSNADYSIRAVYRALIGGNLVTVYSIEGGHLGASRTEYCDGDCYEEGRLVLDAGAP